MVVSLVELACLDTHLWLGTGDKAAPRLQMVQSSISRNVHKVIKEFRLDARRQARRLVVEGDQTLLNEQRLLHQRYRWCHGLPLRLDAQYYAGPLLCQPPPDGWQLGEFDFMEVATPLQLLRQGILDCWIGVYPDIPEPDDPDLICIHLSRYPTHLIVAKGHPLLALGDQITLDDVMNYPSLALPDGAFPKVQQRLEALGLWTSPSRMQRYRQDLWQGRTEDQLTVGYATAFTKRFFPPSHRLLPISIDLQVGDSLIVKRCFVDHPRLQALKNQLRERVTSIASEIDEVQPIVEG